MVCFAVWSKTGGADFGEISDLLVLALTPRPPSIWRLTFLSLSERLRKSKLPSRLQRFCDAATQIVLPP